MKQTLLTLIAALMSLSAMAQAPAFPGAEGTARWTTTGGRGGKVIHVTNLNDAGPGSLREAIETKGPRIVVFDVSGIIELESNLKISRGDISILGQTAPGDGICLKNFSLNIRASNVIIRFIRNRMGDERRSEDDAMNANTRKNNLRNIIVDHCSMSWSTDECGTFWGVHDLTLQWCILSEGLRCSVHDKGSHGYGGIWGGHNAFFHHNLLAHHDSRNPRFDHDYLSTLKGPIDFTNNVIYNWGANSTYGGESANDSGLYRKINMVNNYYKPGPATKRSVSTRLAQVWTECSNCTKAMGTSTIVPPHLYLSGNFMWGEENITDDNWLGVDIQGHQQVDIKSPTRFIPEGYEGQTLLTMHTAQIAFSRVLAHAGASLHRDAVDKRIRGEAQQGTFTYTGSNGSTGGLIDTQKDAGGWPQYVSTPRPQDSDNDGMPDAWETANGLNPCDAGDAKTYTLDAKGYYTNIEVYANSLVEDIMKAENEDALETIAEYYPEVTTLPACPDEQ